MPSTYYINADTGNDTTGSGTSGAPWLTLSKAHTSAAGGDTIICQDSTAAYTWATLNFSKALTIEGQSSNGSGAVFNGAGGNVYWNIAQHNCTFKKITLTNATITGVNGPITANTGSGNNVTLENVVFHTITIPVASGIVRNQQDFAIWTWSLTNCVAYNITVASGGSLFYFARPNAGSSFTFTGCTFAISAAQAANFATVIDNPSTAASGITMTIKNSIFYFGTTVAAFVTDTDVATTATSSNFYQITGSPTGTGVITTDPLLIDLTNGNLNLRPTSPCIGTGVDI